MIDSIDDYKFLNYPLYDLLCVWFLGGTVMRTLYPLLLHIWFAHSKDSDNAVNLVILILKFFGDNSAENQDLVLSRWRNIKASLAYSDFSLFSWHKWQKELTLSSLLSPSRSKGQNLQKAAHWKNETTPKIFWLEAFFALLGFMTVGMPFLTRGSGHIPDLVIFYPLFQKTDWNFLRKTVLLCKQYTKESKKFKISSNYSPQKLSALLLLDLYRARLSLNEQFIPNEQILGLATTSYKFMTANHSPDSSSVFRLSSAQESLNQDSKKSIAHLKRLQAELENLDDTVTEGFTVFRDFLAYLENEDLKAWIRFTLYLTDYRLKTISSPLLPPCISEFFKELSQMSSKHRDYRPIIQDPGLKDLAYAINFCAVRIVYRKQVKKVASAFKIHHGIGFELLRASNDSETFLRVVSNFIHEYMNESLSIFLATREKRKSISASTYESIVNLVSLYGSDLVAHILVGLAFSDHFMKPKADDLTSKDEGEKA